MFVFFIIERIHQAKLEADACKMKRNAYGVLVESLKAAKASYEAEETTYSLYNAEYQEKRDILINLRRKLEEIEGM